MIRSVLSIIQTVYFEICFIFLIAFPALSGLLFPGQEEAAYSNFRLWESTGSVITYAYSPYLCTNVKLYLLLGLLIIGAIGYTGVEYVQYRDRQEDLDDPKKGKFELIKGSLKTGEIAE